LPWRGYFDLIDDVDCFIIYDHVQYTRKDWRNRNRIKTHQGLCWISVPVIFSLNNPTSIRHTPIDYKQSWQKKHMRSIEFAYKSSSYFKHYSQELFDIISSKLATISELNITLIKWAMEKLCIRTSIHTYEPLKTESGKTENIIAMLKNIEATKYLVGPNAKNYMDEKAFMEAGIVLEYKSYSYPQYPQLHGPFEPNVSVIDLLFNCGPHSKDYLKSRIANVTAVG
jgi:hypothetical protein